MDKRQSQLNEVNLSGLLKWIKTCILNTNHIGELLADLWKSLAIPNGVNPYIGVAVRKKAILVWVSSSLYMLEKLFQKWFNPVSFHLNWKWIASCWIGCRRLPTHEPLLECLSENFNARSWDKLNSVIESRRSLQFKLHVFHWMLESPSTEIRQSRSSRSLMFL